MFSLRRPAGSLIRRNLEITRNTPDAYGTAWEKERDPEDFYAPKGFRRYHLRTVIGQGEKAYEAARAAFCAWVQFDLGWVRVANPEVPIKPEEIVTVEAHTFGLWSVNFSRILYVIDEEHRFGYAYGTTPLHVESGEERFLIEFDHATGSVFYDLLAVSRPAHWLAQLGYPYTRSQQHRFARESHRRMQSAIKEP